jgi:hypothetical protein
LYHKGAFASKAHSHLLVDKQKVKLEIKELLLRGRREGRFQSTFFSFTTYFELFTQLNSRHKKYVFKGSSRGSIAKRNNLGTCLGSLGSSFRPLFPGSDVTSLHLLSA